MFYEDPEIEGERLGWKLLTPTLVKSYKLIYKPFYEKIKEMYGAKHFQLLYEPESSFSQINPKRSLDWCIFVVENEIVIYDLDKYETIRIQMENICEIRINQMRLKNYKIEMFFFLENDEKQLVRHNLLFQTIVLINNKLEKKIGEELISPMGLISFLRSHPAYKSSL